MSKQKITLETKSNIILLKVFCEDDYFNECTFAVMKVTKEMLADIRAMKSVIDIVKGRGSDDPINQQLYKMTYWSPSWSAEFLHDSDVPDDLLDKADSDKEIQYISKMIERGDELCVESDVMHLYPEGIAFDCLVKHTNVKLTTARISFKELGL